MSLDPSRKSTLNQLESANRNMPGKRFFTFFCIACRSDDVIVMPDLQLAAERAAGAVECMQFNGRLWVGRTATIKAMQTNPKKQNGAPMGRAVYGFR